MGLIKVNEVEAFVLPTHPHIPVLECHLEDGRNFYLYYVPLEIVVAINNLRHGGKFISERESVYDILSFLKNDLRGALGKHLEKVIIDELNPQTMLYTATLEIKTNGALIKRKMVPSHAIFLALIAEKEIYVESRLVDQQEKLRKKEGDY